MLTVGLSVESPERCVKNVGLVTGAYFSRSVDRKNNEITSKSTSQLNSGMRMSYQRDNVGSFLSYLPPG